MSTAAITWQRMFTFFIDNLHLPVFNVSPTFQSLSKIIIISIGLNLVHVTNW